MREWVSKRLLSVKLYIFHVFHDWFPFLWKMWCFTHDFISIDNENTVRAKDIVEIDQNRQYFHCFFCFCATQNDKRLNILSRVYF